MTKRQEVDAFASRHARSFYYLAYRIVHNSDDASDIVQDSLMGLFLHWDKVGTSSPPKYLERVRYNWTRQDILNRSRHVLRDRRTHRDKEEFTLEVMAELATSDVGFADAEMKEMLDRWLRELTEEEQTILRRINWQRLTYLQTQNAQRHVVPAKAVRSTVGEYKAADVDVLVTYTSDRTDVLIFFDCGFQINKHYVTATLASSWLVGDGQTPVAETVLFHEPQPLVLKRTEASPPNMLDFVWAGKDPERQSFEHGVTIKLRSGGDLGLSAAAIHSRLRIALEKLKKLGGLYGDGEKE